MLTCATLPVGPRYVAGCYGGMRRPSEFICLVLKMLQIQPDKEIIIEFIKNDDYKYLRLLGAFYLRLVGAWPDASHTCLTTPLHLGAASGSCAHGGVGDRLRPSPLPQAAPWRCTSTSSRCTTTIGRCGCGTWTAASI